MAIRFDKGWIARIDVVPSTLAVGTIYWALKNNQAAGKQLYIAEIAGTTTFTGTAAATRSVFGFHRKTGTPTTGTVINPTLLNSGAPTGGLSCLEANTGLSGVTIGVNDQFATIAHPSQLLVSAHRVRIIFEDENPFIVEAGEFLCLFAFATLIAGVGFNGHVLFYGN